MHSDSRAWEVGEFQPFPGKQPNQHEDTCLVLTPAGYFHIDEVCTCRAEYKRARVTQSAAAGCACRHREGGGRGGLTSPRYIVVVP